MTAAHGPETDCGSGERASRSLRLAKLAARTRADVPLVLLDAMLCLGSYVGAIVLRFDGAVPPGHWHRFWSFVPLAVTLHLAANWTWRLYGQIWKHASVQEARRILLSGMSAITVLVLSGFVGPRRVPLSVVVLGGWCAAMLMGAMRFHSRLFALRRSDRRAIHRVAVLGAGESGAAIVRDMLRNPDVGLQPVVLLDDNPRKQGRSMHGIPIAGGIDDLSSLAGRLNVHQALLAVPSADQALVKRAHDAAAAANLPLRVLPSVGDLVKGTPSIRDVRDLKIEDLLGRAQVETDLDSVRSLLAGRRVLITGAGGSIGSEILRQVSAFGPAQVIALDHDETHLHDAVQGLAGEVVQVLADIRDRHEIEAIFCRFLPDVVFHAAAHKHVPILETYACEAAATNVLGTRNVLRSAARSGVRHLVVISTDKAVRPSCNMGASKWLSEQLMLSLAPEGGRYCAVRFGNVLGSRGSVIPTFTRQIAAGGPVTVTDMNMTRFFMSIREAVQLVLQAAALAVGREIFMLDMGSPVRIYDLATRMITLAGHEPGTDIEIIVTGVRPGEKLAEELVAPWELSDPTRHPSILRVRPLAVPRPELDAVVDQLTACVRARRHGEAGAVLHDLPARYGLDEPPDVGERLVAEARR